LRWSVLVAGPISFQVLGGIDVALAVFTFAALLGANTQTDPDAVPGGRAWRFCYRLAFIGLLGVLGWQFYVQVLQVGPAPVLASEEEHFKYGSFGNDKARGLPKYVFEALPDAFPDKLPGGWESLGFLFEEAHRGRCPAGDRAGCPVRVAGFSRFPAVPLRGGSGRAFHGRHADGGDREAPPDGWF
jgi:hypothetical protein